MIMRLLTILSALALIAYPVAVYYGINRWGITTVGALLAVFFIVRIIAAKQTQLKELKYIGWLSGGVGITLILLGTLFRQQGLLLYYPVIVNILMLGLFSSSLWQQQSLIERLARLQEPDLPASGIRYTRNVTKIWCVFFIINGAIALITCFMPLHIWTLYNGFISYLLAGSLFGIEWLCRQWFRHKHAQ